MQLLNKSELPELMASRKGPCVSIFMPTHGAGRETRQDRIRLKNLLSRAEEQLAAKGLKQGASRLLLEPAHALLDDADFWRHQSDGLAMFLAPDFFRAYRLPIQLKELVVVNSQRLHAKPILPMLMGDGRFFLLAFSQKQVRLYRGDRFGLTKLEAKDLPTGLPELLEATDYQDAIHFHPTGPSETVRGAAWAKRHAQGEGADELRQSKLQEYWMRLARGVHDYLNDEHAPLVVAALSNAQGHYREINSYANLVDTPVVCNPDAYSDRELHKLAYEAVAPLYEQAKQAAAHQFFALEGEHSGRAARDVQAVVPAAAFGRVDVLFARRGHQVWGRFDPDRNEVEIHDPPRPDDEDLLDLAAAKTFQNKGRVYVLDVDEMPIDEPVAAILRY